MVLPTDRPMTEPSERKRYDTGFKSNYEPKSYSILRVEIIVTKIDRPAVAMAWSFAPALAMRAMRVVVMPEPSLQT